VSSLTTARRARILVVEDDPGTRLALRDRLEAAGWDVVEADSLKAAGARLDEGNVDAVITDYALPDGNSLVLLERFKTRPALPVIVLTGHGTIDLAVQAIQQGAEHFLTKPVEWTALEPLLRRALARERDRKRLVANQSGRAAAEHDPFLGTSNAIRRLEADARRMLSSDSPVLILGETGSGKGVLAHWLHRNSPRRDEPYVDLNCAGLKREFLESELFGHEKGAFTGATATKPGLFEVAHGGTLFLDEIGDTDLEVQAKLLKAIEEKRFRRMGEVRPRHVDVRIVAATHHALLERARAGLFRGDLYFRISALPLEVPPLRDRREDIPLLARHLLAAIALDVQRPELGLAPGADDALRAYDWPGNLRELRNVLERAALHGQGPEIGPATLRFDLGAAADPRAAAPVDDLGLTLKELERRHIERVLAAEGGHVERTAVRLGIARSTLYDTLRRLGIKH
jgi:DNA-binding NtrC family response regulator